MQEYLALSELNVDKVVKFIKWVDSDDVTDDSNDTNDTNDTSKSNSDDTNTNDDDSVVNTNDNDSVNTNDSSDGENSNSDDNTIINNDSESIDPDDEIIDVSLFGANELIEEDLNVNDTTNIENIDEIDEIDDIDYNDLGIHKYNKKKNESSLSQIREIGIIDRQGYYHKYRGFNKFTKESFPIPYKEDGWYTLQEEIKNNYEEEKENTDETFEEYKQHRELYFRKWVKQHICDPSVKIFHPDALNCVEKLSNLPEFKMYKTLDNYSVGYVVVTGKKNKKNVVYVYQRTNDVLTKKYTLDQIEIFNKFVAKIVPHEIFIGESLLNDMTKKSGGCGEKWDGNSILLRVGNLREFRYLHIGVIVCEFVTDQQITKYISSVGNNCVPYPYAESKDFCYCMSDFVKTPITDHPDREKLGTVSFDENATYTRFDIEIIAERGIDNVKTELSISKNTHYVKKIQIQ